MQRSHVLAAAFAAAVLGSTPSAGEAPDYEFIQVPQQAIQKPVPKYRFIYGQAARWPGPLRWKYNHGRAPAPFAADPAGTVAQVVSALDAWTRVCGITHVYEGQTTIEPDTRVHHPRFGVRPDYVNVVGWAELTGNQAGVAWVWHEGDVLVDADILLSPDHVQDPQQLTRTGRHEWGHALGLGHSNLNAALMSGPPTSSYNGGTSLQTDDRRGCRCLYGPAAGQPEGYSCSLPEKLELGGASVGDASQPQTLTLVNHGNGPLKVEGVALSSPALVRDEGCPPGLVLEPGQSCLVSVIARPSAALAYDEFVTFTTSDGQYVVPATFTGLAAPPSSASTVQLVEYHHAAFDHYFVTHLEDEIAALEQGGIAGWTATGRTIRAWGSPAGASSPACRFFSERFAPKSSHFYTAFPFECQNLKAGADWSFEGEVFHAALPDAQGNCVGGTMPLFRVYNNGRGGAPNHRLTTDPSLRAQMIAQGWAPEGVGPGVTMCVPF